MWAESYERDLRNILALQSEVAQAIAREVQIKLIPQEQAAALIESAEPKFPNSDPLKRAKRFAYLKLMERNQNTDPFKFIIYSARSGEQTPQINAEGAK